MCSKLIYLPVLNPGGRDDCDESLMPYDGIACHAGIGKHTRTNSVLGDGSEDTDSESGHGVGTSGSLNVPSRIS
jgi:hypothetical protein